MHNNEGKKSNGLIILVVVLVLLVLGLGGYITYDKVFKNKDNQESNNKEDKPTSLSNEEISKFLNEVPYTWFGSVEGEKIKTKVFTNSKVTVDKLNQEGFFNYLTTTETFDKKKESFETCRIHLNEAEVINKLGDYGDMVIESAGCISLSDLKQIVKELYNYDNFTIKENELIPIPGGSATLYEGKVYFYYGAGATMVSKKTIDHRYEIKGDELYIYEKIVIINQWPEIVDDPVEIDCYTDEVSESFDSIYVPFNTWLSIEELDLDYSSYDKLLREYKHTFKKNSSGNYYWYSTEPNK